MGFIEAQADYIRFLYGLSLVILATVSFTGRLMAGSPLSLRWLAVFGAAHGLHEWVHVVVASRPEFAAFAPLKDVLALASFAALFEFARSNRIPGAAARPALRIPGWQALVVFAAGCTLLAMDAASAYAWLMRGLIFVTTFWAAAAMVACARDPKLAGRAWLLCGAVVMLIYGQGESTIKTVVVIAFERGLLTMPRAALMSVLTAFHAALSIMLSLSLWAFVRCQLRAVSSSDAVVQAAQATHRRYTIWLALSLLIVLTAGWYGTELIGRQSEAHIHSRSQAATRVLASHLRDEMARTDLMANLLAKSPLARQALTQRSADNLAQAEIMLRQHTAVLESSTAFLMTPDGTNVASSGGPEDSGKKGENFGFLSYFQDSSAYGLTGRDLAVEPTPGQRGYYVSNPVMDASGELLGVAVVKKVLAQTDKEFKRYANWFLLSPNGIIFLSSRPELLLRPMWALPATVRNQIVQSGQLGAGPFDAPLLDDAPIDGLPIAWEGGKALANVVSVREDGWTAIVVAPMVEIAGQRIFGIATTLFVSLFIVCFLVVVQREASYEQKLAEDKLRLEALNEELERQATTDVLTGSCNRMKFDTLLLAEVDRANRYGSHFSLVMLDIDHFKRINDTYGHQVGDRCLEAVGRLSRDTVRRSDVFARWGGEEFMILLPMTPLDGTCILVERLRTAFTQHDFAPVPALTCSFGVTEYRRGDSVETLVKRADDALYRAKEAGRNRVELEVEGDVAAA